MPGTVSVGGAQVIISPLTKVTSKVEPKIEDVRHQRP